MTRFEKIKDQVAAASVEEMAEILTANDVFCCSFCDHCDSECEMHCINWLNSPAPDE